MKPERYSVELVGAGAISAGSREALIEQLESEAMRWTEYVGSLELHTMVGSYTLRYQELIAHIRDHPDDQAHIRIPLAGLSNFMVLPWSNSTIGRAIRSLPYKDGSGRDNLATSAILSFMSDNDWTGMKPAFADDDSYFQRYIRGGATFLASASYAEQVLGAHPASGTIKAAGNRLLSRIEDNEHLADVLQAESEELKAEVEALRARMAKEEADRRRLLSWAVRRTARLKDRTFKSLAGDFEEVKAKYVHQLQFRAPVELWVEAAANHSRKARNAFGLFTAGLLSTIAYGAVVVLCFGDTIAASFTRIECVSPDTCSAVFSAKGPLTVGAVLLGASLLVWLVRFTNKIYLSERHLSLAAAEKKAFTQSYLALVEDAKVSREQEAVVLASLFRPSQDGIIKDDEAITDLSAAAMIAKALSGR